MRDPPCCLGEAQWMGFSGLHWEVNVQRWIPKRNINSLWPSDAMWRNRLGSTLIRVMSSCLMAPSHYRNQRRLLISEVLCFSPESNFTISAQAPILCNEFESCTCKITCTSPRRQWVTSVIFSHHSFLMIWSHGHHKTIMIDRESGKKRLTLQTALCLLMA